MSGQLTERLAPPEDLRPAQLGIILVGRVIIGHISATLIDLSGRGFLRIEEVPGGESPQWLLTDLRDQAANSGVPLFPFELALLGGLFGRHAQASSCSGRSRVSGGNCARGCSVAPGCRPVSRRT